MNDFKDVKTHRAQMLCQLFTPFAKNSNKLRLTCTAKNQNYNQT